MSNPITMDISKIMAQLPHRYPFLLVGGVFSFVMGGVSPAIKRTYRQAEQRRLEAAELRQG